MSYLITLLLSLAVHFGYLKKTGGMYYINKKLRRSPQFIGFGVDLDRLTPLAIEAANTEALEYRMRLATRQH